MCAFLFLSAGAAAAQKPIGDVFASDATVKGSITLAAGGTQVGSGSEITAGDAAAVLRLRRGGTIRICPGTTVTVSGSTSGEQLMVSLGTGAIETHYSLAATADAILTPDFRILLPGPGTFDFAFSADSHGNACVHALPSNSASVIVSELMGDGTFQVRPDQEVYFHDGRVTNPSTTGAPCGCPAPPPVLRASTSVPKPLPHSVTEPPPPINPKDVQVQVDAPFVFRAADAVQRPSPFVARVHVSRIPHGMFPNGTVLAPPPPPAPAPVAKAAAAEKPKKHEKFFGRVRAFFASIFH